MAHGFDRGTAAPLAHFLPTRRVLLGSLGATALAWPWAEAAQAAGLGGALGALLGKASDAALDKLAQPGAFYNDPAIRIGLPLVGVPGIPASGGTGTAAASTGTGAAATGGGLDGVLGSVLGAQGGALGTVGKVLSAGAKLGITDRLIRQLNAAAGVAAARAKPIFRGAIGKLSLTDVPGIVTQNDGGTQYLKRSSSAELKTSLRPLVDSALASGGVFRELDRLGRASKLLAAAGITHDSVGNSVTDQALSGIFRYIGGEEAKLRANPLGPAGNLLGGLLKGGG